MSDQWPTPSDCDRCAARLADAPGNGSLTCVSDELAKSTLAIAELQRQVEELQAETYRLRNGGK